MDIKFEVNRVIAHLHTLDVKPVTSILNRKAASQYIKLCITDWLEDAILNYLVDVYFWGTKFARYTLTCKGDKYNVVINAVSTIDLWDLYDQDYC